MARCSVEDHGELTDAFVGAHRGCDGGPILLRHHQVDDRDLERVLTAPRVAHVAQRLATRFEALPAHAPRVDVALEDRAVGPVVVDDGDLGANKAPGRTGRARPRRRLAEQRGEPETAPLALLALDTDLTSHELRQHAGDGQPKTRAAVAPGG